MKGFKKINKGYNSVFTENALSIGVVVPIENYANGSVPSMKDHLQRVQLVEDLGFKAIWVRDVPFHVPSFGDAGQTYDPFTYLGFLSGQTNKIALGISSIAIPLHHPVHVYKSATTIEQLSGGRLIMGVASGDRYDEYPAMAINYEKRGELFRDSFEYIRNIQEPFPKFKSKEFGELKGHIDVLPKPPFEGIPLLMTGFSQQSLQWNAENGDGWMYYPRQLTQQEYMIKQWRELIAEKQDHNKPFMQPLYIDLQSDDDFKPESIHLGFKTGSKYLIQYLSHLKEIGVNHIAINLRFNTNPVENTLELLAKKVLVHFHQNVKEPISS